MADFYGCLECTSFRVKDREAWLADPDVDRLHLYAERESGFFHEAEGYWAFGWSGQYPSHVLTEYCELDRDACDREHNDGQEHELDITDVIERHILPGDVCQIGVSGNEKLRYIGGAILYVTSKGTAHWNGCTDWGERITTAGLHDRVVAFCDQLDGMILDLPKETTP